MMEMPVPFIYKKRKHKRMAGINPKLRLTKKALKDADYYVHGVLSSDRFVLAEALTIVEGTDTGSAQLTSEILAKLTNEVPPHRRVAITGPPGAGKSTMIDTLGRHLDQQGSKVAVLAIDPSSTLSKGSVLGDKTRMDHLSRLPNAFIRPSPTSGSLGGIARATRISIDLCAYAGYDTIIIETVGVGQSETTVSLMADLFILLLIPGGGDEVQGIKRGIVEMADIVVFNKSDGQTLAIAKQNATQYQQALHLLPARHAHWTPRVLRASAMEGTGIDQLLESIDAFFNAEDTTWLSTYRRSQDLQWYEQHVADILVTNFIGRLHQHPDWAFQKQQVQSGHLKAYQALLNIPKMLEDVIGE